MRQNKTGQSDVNGGAAWIGPLPASAGCDCLICRPEAAYDAMDRRMVDTVLERGWQVVAVSDDGGCDCAEHRRDETETAADPEPPFAYTVGLGHRCGHPELLMSGMTPEAMGAALNNVAQRVFVGLRLKPGDLLEGVLGGAPVVIERASEEALNEVVLLSGYFHRRSPEALVVVWPTNTGLFAWQPGAPDALHDAQPLSWREPFAHIGGAAPAPDWLFPVPPEQKVFSCTHVVTEGGSIHYVAREADDERGEDWSIMCGLPGHPTEELCLVHLAHLVRAAPSLRMVSGLALGEEAIRASVDSGWLVRPVCV